MFTSMGRARAQKEGNHRTVLDAALLKYFIGQESLIKGWQQRSAVLSTLEPRDRLRMLGLVRPPCPSDNYMFLKFKGCRASELFSCACSASSIRSVSIDPTLCVLGWGATWQGQGWQRSKCMCTTTPLVTLTQTRSGRPAGVRCNATLTSDSLVKVVKVSWISGFEF